MDSFNPAAEEIERLDAALNVALKQISAVHSLLNDADVPMFAPVTGRIPPRYLSIAERVELLLAERAELVHAIHAEYSQSKNNLTSNEAVAAYEKHIGPGQTPTKETP